MSPKYDSLRKADPKEVLKCVNAHPDWSLKEIGAKFGITASRVHQIKKAKPKL